MSTLALGAITFSDTPDVNGDLVLTSATGLTPSTGVTSVLGTAGQITVSGAVPTFTLSLPVSVVLPGTGSTFIVDGTTAQRPAVSAGQLRYNTSTNYPEYSNATVWRPLGINQVLQQVFGSFALQTGTSAFANTTTVPVSTVGTAVTTTMSITPSATTSVIKIEISTTMGSSVGGATVNLGLFRGTTCIAVKQMLIATIAGSVPVHFSLVDSPASVAAVVYSLRIGLAVSGAWFFGETSAGTTFGGVGAGHYILQEIAP